MLKYSSLGNIHSLTSILQACSSCSKPETLERQQSHFRNVILASPLLFAIVLSFYVDASLRSILITFSKAHPLLAAIPGLRWEQIWQDGVFPVLEEPRSFERAAFPRSTSILTSHNGSPTCSISQYFVLYIKSAGATPGCMISCQVRASSSLRNLGLSANPEASANSGTQVSNMVSTYTNDCGP